MLIPLPEARILITVLLRIVVLGLATSTMACSEPDEPLQPSGSKAAASSGSGGETAAPCPAGERLLEDGSCAGAGVPADGCAHGFTHEAGGCTPVLPAERCPDATMEVLGDTRCQPVMSCGEAPWGDIEVGDDTQYVDAAYAGSDSDGSADKPWTTIQAGVDAAADGAVVAVAAGSYPENVVVESPITLWGRCPTLVHVEGQDAGYGAVMLLPGASGATVRGVGLTGNGPGLAATGVEDAVVDRVWAHDLASFGVGAQSDYGAPQLTVTDSLVERASYIGFASLGSDLTVERSVVRDPRPEPPIEGAGVVAQPHLGDRASIVVRGCVLLRSRLTGIAVTGGDGTIEGTYVADVQIPEGVASAVGMQVRESPLDGAPSTATIVGSVFERNPNVGVRVQDSTATIERTVVRDTLSGAAVGPFMFGRGIDVATTAPDAPRAAVTVRSSLVERNREIGVVGFGADLLLEGVLVRETLPIDTGHFGRGVVIQTHPVHAYSGSASIHGCLLQGNHGSGLSVVGSQVSVTDTAIRDTQPEPANGLYGRGVSIQHHPDGPRSTAALTRVVVERSHEAGICIIQSDVTLDDVLVSDTAPLPANGGFGDGVSVDGEFGPASLTLTSSRISGNARAGVANFGAAASIEGTEISCNSIDLNGEDFGGDYSFEDRGGNRCGCEGTETSCAVLSSNLEPPAALDD